ncbi:MAG: fatty acid desaturase [Acidobacteriota bacterium]|nr:fatty acid desaturase [Acidobacteriota bacterium]
MVHSSDISAVDRTKISWVTATTFAVFHVLAVVALFYTTWPVVVLGVVLHWVCGSWGIGMGYHRLHTHRSYRVPKPLEYFFAVCGTLTLQGGPIFWTAIHRIHHQRADQTGDPHTPRDGKWWAHFLWTIFGEELHANTEVTGRFAPDLMKDRFYRVLNSWHWVPLVALGLVLLAIGGWPWVLWGVFLRVVVGLHCTWLVNSATHLWGTRRFPTNDDSKNNWWVALLTFGEGWHNNHHAHPTAAKHGREWKELDLNWLQIRLLSWLGLAWDVQASPRMIEIEVNAPVQPHR